MDPGSRWGRRAARAVLAVEQWSSAQAGSCSCALPAPPHFPGLDGSPTAAEPAATLSPTQNVCPARRPSDHLHAVETRVLKEAEAADLDAAAPTLAGDPQQHSPVFLHFQGPLSDFSMAAELFASWFSRMKTLSRKLPPQPALFRLPARFSEGSAGRPYNSPTEREEER